MASRSKKYSGKPQHKHKFAGKRGGKKQEEEEFNNDPDCEDEEVKGSGSDASDDSNDLVEPTNAASVEASQHQTNAPLKLYMWYFEQCDPKKCSGMALKKIGMLKTLPVKAKFNGIVLTPATDKLISLADADLLTEFGVSVIDCSWAFFETVSVRSIRTRERILPNLLAANPINYGKEFKLNCAEAIAAAYYLCGFEEEAREIMSHFKYGPAFFAVNEFRFSRYRGCTTHEEMLQAQTEVLSELQ